MAILEVDDVFRFFHPGDAEVRALRGACLTVRRYETVALIGPSGSGKSTLLACIAGLDEPDGGVVTIDGRRMTRRPEAEKASIRAESIGFMAQSGNLFAHLCVAENMRLAMGLRKLRGHRERIASLLARVGLEGRGDASPGTLSGGETARASLAVALAADPALLIADEPTAEVDAETEARILDVLEDRRMMGGAALIATHSRALGGRATRIVAISDGRIREGWASTPPAAAGDAQILASGPLAVTRAGGRAALIEARGVGRSYALAGQRVDAVLPVNCAVFAKQRIALVGRSGGGKSTLLNMLAGLETPSAGVVAWPGLNKGLPLRPRQIGFVFQAPSLIPELTAFENVRLPLDISGLWAGDAMDPDEALARLSLGDLRDKLPDQMSGGQMQRVALARALVTRPKVLFADEPTGQLDRATAGAVMQALLAALADGDTALVVATHDPEVAGLMQEIWRMDGGRLHYDETRRAVA